MKTAYEFFYKVLLAYFHKFSKIS